MGAWRPSRLGAGVCVLAALVGCGKKGPPLAPLVRVPASVADVSARRIGMTVHLQFTIPSANEDGSRPADLERVEIYAYSGTPIGDATTLRRRAEVVGTVLVQRPRESAPAESSASPRPGGETRPNVPEPPAPGLPQGATAVLIDNLAQAASGPPAASKTTPGDRPPARAGTSVGPLWPGTGPTGVRHYVAVAVSHRARRSRLSRRVTVPLAPPPPAPSAVDVTYSEQEISVTWVPPGGGGTEESTEDASGVPPSLPPLPSRPVLSSGPSRFSVYEVPAPAGGAPAAPAAARRTTAAVPPFPKPLNAAPLEKPEFTDARVNFGTSRCYAVTTVEAVGGGRLESELSDPACVELRDMFPPAAPRSLAAVASEGAISLIWEPNTEQDLAGYLVLRGGAAGEKLQELQKLLALTPMPIRETTFRDTTVRPGQAYIYAVVAVDRATPPNFSEESNRVQESAR